MLPPVWSRAALSSACWMALPALGALVKLGCAVGASATTGGGTRGALVVIGGGGGGGIGGVAVGCDTTGVGAGAVLGASSRRRAIVLVSMTGRSGLTVGVGTRGTVGIRSS